MRANKIVSAIILMCFLLNAAVSDLAFGLATPSAWTSIVGIQHKDMAMINLALEEQLVALEHSGLSMNRGTFQTVLNDRHLQERTIFQPADMQFFWHEPKGAIGESLCYMVRLRDKYELRTYYATFSLQKDENGGFPIKVYTEDQYKGAAGFTKGIPQIKAEDAKAIERYVQHEKGIDAVIEYAHEKGLARNPAGNKFDYKHSVVKLLKQLNIKVENPDNLIPIEDREFFLIPLTEDIKRMIAFLPKAKIVDINGREHEVRYSAHSSDNAMHVFVSEEGFKNLTEWKDYNSKTPIFLAALLDTELKISHEIGAICNEPIVRVEGVGVVINTIDKRMENINDGVRERNKPITIRIANLGYVAVRDYMAGETTPLQAAANAQESSIYLFGREPSQYGPHPSQENLRPLFERIAWARKNAPNDFKVKNIYAFKDQKHGMKPKEAISFGIVLEHHKVIITDASVMGGISAGGLEPSTHAGVQEAIKFFNDNVASKFIGLNIARPDEITNKIIEIDEKFRNAANDKTAPKFSYIGAEIAVGISMVSTIALAEALHVPVEVVINYRYNEYALSNGLAKEVRPMSIPVNYSVVWEGGKHGVSKYLHELVKEGIVKDDTRFPARFKDEGLISKKDKSILLAMVPPQELQIIVFAPVWKEAERIGIKLTERYEKVLQEDGIKTKYGAESGFTTEQVRTADGRLITTELVLDILEQATNSLTLDEAKYVRYADDLAASEMYIPEIDMYYIGTDAAATIPGISEKSKKDGLVTNAEFTQYKLARYKNHPRFISCEDWADEGKIEHWQDAKQIMSSMIQMGDDNNVSRADLIRKFKDVQNAHLHKPNQVSEEQASMESVATSHSLGNVVVWSHRGTRSPQEKYTAWGAIGTGSFAGKWTLFGPGRSALPAAMTQADTMYREVYDTEIPYQGGLVLNPNGPYKNYGFAKRIRGEIAVAEAKAWTEKSKELNALFNEKLVAGDTTVIPEILAYHSALTNSNDQQIFYEWLQHHESALAAEAIAKVGLIWETIVQKLVSIINGSVDGNRHAAARQLTELVDQGTYGGLKAPDKVVTNAEIALNKLSQVVSELVQPVAFPEVPKVSEGVKPGMLVITRHGETSWSETLLNKWAGWHDAKITENGGQEAFNSGKRLHGIDLHFDLGFTSDLSRAQVTMQRFLEGFGQPDLPISSYRELRERNYGDLTGWRRALVEKIFGENQYKKWRRGYEGNNVRPPAGENLRDVMERSIPCFVENMFREIANGKNVSISAHGNSLRSILIYLRQRTTGKTLTEEEAMKLEVPLSTPIVVKFDQNLKHEELWVKDKIGSKEINEFLVSKRYEDSSEKEIDTMISLASEAGLQIPTHPNERYNLLVTSEFFANGEFEEHSVRYGDRFDLDKISGVSPKQFVNNILAKATGKETKTIALVPSNLSAEQLKILTKAGIRFVRVNTADLQKAKSDKDANREKFQVDTYAMMLLLRRIDNSITADSSMYRLLSFYLKSHFELTDKIAIDDYIMAIVNNDVARLIKGCLSYRPAQPYEAPNYNNVAASLISA